MCRNNVRSNSVKTTLMCRFCYGEEIERKFHAMEAPKLCFRRHLMTILVTFPSQRSLNSAVPRDLSICPGQCVLQLTKGTSCCSSREGSQMTNPEQKLSPIPGSLNIFHRYPGFIYLLIDVISWIKHSFLDYLCYYKYNWGGKKKHVISSPFTFEAVSWHQLVFSEGWQMDNVITAHLTDDLLLIFGVAYSELTSKQPHRNDNFSTKRLRGFGNPQFISLSWWVASRWPACSLHRNATLPNE